VKERCSDSNKHQMHLTPARVLGNTALHSIS